MVNSKSIREMLQFQDLTEEEKTKRGILGRLYGPCASIIDATRNGRCYGDELWENVFSKNDIVKEMFDNGGIPMELDHPVDREETDSSRIAAMLPEPPKRDSDGHLICYVDLIDTPCGKIAYQLAKYGFKLGISSRGSGDVLPDDNVDPDTYDFTTFDLVLLPAVKDARLSMCESLDKNKAGLKKALAESYNSLSSDEDRKTMKKILEDLDLDIEDDNNIENDVDDDAIMLTTESLSESKEDSDENDIQDIEMEEVEEISDEETNETSQTAEDIIKNLDKDTKIEFAPIIIDGVEYPVKQLNFDTTDDKVVISIDYDSNMSDNIDEISKDETSNEEDVEPTDEDAEIEVENTSEEVIDDESKEVIENLKEAIRQKDLLENEIKTLKNDYTVRDTEVKALSEELNKYKTAFNRISSIAAGAKKSESEVKTLTEKLSQKDKEISSLKKSRVAQLNEGVKIERNKIKTLTERLEASNEKLQEKENQLAEQTKAYNKKLHENINVIKKYKAQTNAVLTEYINFRASMLGVKPTEITNRLNESYTMSDINSVCNEILELGMPSVQFNLNKSSKLKITESKQEDDDLNDLYILAGLK